MELPDWVVDEAPARTRGGVPLLLVVKLFRHGSAVADPETGGRRAYWSGQLARLTGASKRALDAAVAELVAAGRAAGAPADAAGRPARLQRGLRRALVGRGTRTMWPGPGRCAGHRLGCKKCHPLEPGECRKCRLFQTPRAYEWWWWRS